jgi:hypothetical protein
MDDRVGCGKTRNTQGDLPPTRSKPTSITSMKVAVCGQRLKRRWSGFEPRLVAKNMDNADALLCRELLDRSLSRRITATVINRCGREEFRDERRATEPGQDDCQTYPA